MTLLQKLQDQANQMRVEQERLERHLSGTKDLIEALDSKIAQLESEKPREWTMYVGKWDRLMRMNHPMASAYKEDAEQITVREVKPLVLTEANIHRFTEVWTKTGNDDRLSITQKRITAAIAALKTLGIDAMDGSDE